MSPAEKLIAEYAKKYVAHIPTSENQRIPHLHRLEATITTLIGDPEWVPITDKKDKLVVTFVCRHYRTKKRISFKVNTRTNEFIWSTE